MAYLEGCDAVLHAVISMEALRASINGKGSKSKSDNKCRKMHFNCGLETIVVRTSVVLEYGGSGSSFLYTHRCKGYKAAIAI